MSLLIPTVNDYEDAHGGAEQEEVYRQRAAQLDRAAAPWQFEIVPGFFRQSDAATNDLEFNYATMDFGVLKPWPQVRAELAALNHDGHYKLLFLARHGQGFHNVCVEKYGLAAWSAKWHALGTDGEIVYAPDPQLTERGVAQARQNQSAWRQQLAAGAPMPSRWIVLPLQRSCHTVVATWEGLRPPHAAPLVVEQVRETLGVNLCDKRSPRSVIEQRFKPHGFEIDALVTEEDELYTEHHRETLAEQSLRTNAFLQRLFETPDEVVCVTSHAGTIRSFLTVLGHRHFTISTGGMIPVMVRATRR